MTAHRDDSACTGAVVRKPPMKETALGERGAVPRVLIYRGLTLAAAVICQHKLLRYGTNVANGGKQLLHHVQFQRVTCGRNSPYFNFCVMCLIASSVPHRANRYFQVIDAIRRKLFSLSSLYITVTAASPIAPVRFFKTDRS